MLYIFLRLIFVPLKNCRGRNSKYMPYMFTQYRITMFAGLLKSKVADKKA